MKNLNGKGKEYYDWGGLEFEGEYLNGRRNGKGKEYDDLGNLEFEGEYLYGKRWEGKGYDKFGKIVYELKGGKGLIKQYEFHGKMKYECEYLNREKTGKGKEYYYKGTLEFEGEYLNGKRNGQGK